ncbi:hypothetical protein [Flavobacterium sp.]|uniref:hypothetical protein n=1 Tax=Flavobacterium sp. TaxID=239 RepID=UPI00286BAEF6|nr:hypothetical protein [Flavobacterium sp.]
MKISPILKELLYDSYEAKILIVNQKEQQTLIDKHNCVFFRAYIENDEEFLIFKDENNNYWLSPNHTKICIDNVSCEIPKLNEPLLNGVFNVTATSQKQILIMAIQYFSKFSLPNQISEAWEQSIIADVKHQKSLEYSLLEFPKISNN